MSNKSKKTDNVGWILICVLGVVLGILLLVSGLKDISDNVTITTTESVPNVKADTGFTCPIGESADSNKLINDWFDCSDIKLFMNQEVNDKKIDCNNIENYNVEKIYFNIFRKCEKGDYILYSGDCNERGGILKPIVASNVYPSLNEYYFNSTSVEFKNLGCTKINLENYGVIYALYQNGEQLDIKSKLLSEDIAINSLLEDDTIYPDAWIMTSLFFGESTFGNSIKLNSPNDLEFKMCVIDIIKHKIVSCDYTRFNLEYK